MGPIWVLSAPDGPHVSAMNFTIKDKGCYWNERKKKSMCIFVLVSTLRFQCWELIWNVNTAICFSISRYSDVIMSEIASQITGVSIVYSTICSGVDQGKHESSASLAFVRGIHQWTVNSPHKGPGTQKMFPFDDVIMSIYQTRGKHWYRNWYQDWG